MNSIFKTALVSLALASRSISAEPPLPPGAVAAGTNAPAPQIQFASPVFDFGRIPEGEVVQHTFVFTNTGNLPLKILGVHTSCGCTSAGEWSTEVAPGMTGSIPLQFNSTRFPGTIIKTATVTCNDPRQPSIYLQLKGTVWKPIEVTPPTAVLNVTPETVSNATALVRIVSNLDQPLTLSPPESNNRAFAATLNTVQPGKEFHLTVSAASAMEPGTHQGSITIKTSSTNLPLIQVIALAIVRPAVVIAPAQILLAAKRAPAYAVSILNNGANPLTLSDAEVNAAGVGVQVKEVQPGRQFTVTVTFPPGFEVAPGEEVALTLKSSHPQFSTLKVPVRQYPPPQPRTTVLRDAPWPPPPTAP